jgi:hypothetical protein
MPVVTTFHARINLALLVQFFLKKLYIAALMPSTVVSYIHYFPATQILRVSYVSGAVYDYKNVPEEIYKAMKNAFSKGTYLNKYVKGNYSFEKVKEG